MCENTNYFEDESKFKIQVQVLEDGKLPTKAHNNDAGFDVYATSDIVIYPGQVIKHPLNIKFDFPGIAWGTITSKSGLGAKGLLVYAGVIDNGYTGICNVVMNNINLTKPNRDSNLEPIVIAKGQKLAQIIITPYDERYYMVQVDEILKKSERGAGGFGSSGK